MPVDIRLISLRDFVRTELVGAVDLETSKAALTELARSTAECGVPNILDVGASDVAALVEHLLALEVDPGYRIAILNDPKDGVDRGKLFEEHARRLGIDAAVFRDFEEALAWLCRLPSRPRR